MAIDPTNFYLINVADTCSVWNVLSSKLLYSAAKTVHCDFCITSFVQYECLVKPRKSLTTAEIELVARLRQEQSRGTFKSHSCGIDDLQDIRLLESRHKLGKGELSSIAFAMKTNQAVITDDQRARKLAIESGHARTQTTPHLLAWLIFTNRLGDSDVSVVKSDNKKMGLPLSKHFQDAYEIALQCKLNARPINLPNPS